MDEAQNRPSSKRILKPIQTKNNDYEYYNVPKNKVTTYGGCTNFMQHVLILLN
jgi:hypothetical protein